MPLKCRSFRKFGRCLAGFVLFLMATASWALSEVQLSAEFEQKVVKFLEHSKGEYFYNCEGTSREIHFRIFRNNATRKVIVISPGRGESAWLYAELIYDLHRAGYSVAILDHFGQGDSVRRSEDQSIQDLESFDDYAQDFNHFLRVLDEREFPQSEYQYGLLAHSAGSMIALHSLFREDNPIHFKALAFTAPMMRIRTSPLPFLLAEPMAKALSLFIGESIAPFQKEKNDQDFQKYSENRGRRRRDLLRHLHYEKTGRRGLYPSVNWAKEALRAARRIQSLRLKQPIPTLVLSPTRDSLVQPESASRVTQVVGSDCELFLIEQASHDVWTETDNRRTNALQKTLEHFQKNL